MNETGTADRADLEGNCGTIPTRRRFLEQVAVAGAIGVAGCIDSAEENTDAVDNAQEAVVHFVTEGYEKYNGESLSASGSGFVIDSAGIVVTNNHVVTGADSIEAFVGTDQRSADATILGVSECADLAVLEIDGNGYPFLEWYDGDISAGLNVWALGFAGDDPSSTTTEGTVTAVRETSSTWTSIDSEIEHTARIREGNSGGPLVDGNGRVVGVNYAAIDKTQNFAIGVNTATDIVEELRAGTDVSSIGIDGTAVPADSHSPAGIWVSAVADESPASNAGIQADDVITAIGDSDVGEDGTVREYCNVLQRHSTGDVLAIQVYRDGTVLEGEINGRKLESVSDIDNDARESDRSSSEYTTIRTETETIQVDSSVIGQ